MAGTRLPFDDGDLETPVALLDVERARANASAVGQYCRERSLRWRPHIKTHKCLEVARIQLAAGASGLTVATLREAEVMSALTDDLLLAYPPVGRPTLERLARVSRSVRLTVALDSKDVAEPLARVASVERPLGVLVEFDAGLRRVGLQHPGEAVELAAWVAEQPTLDYRGLMFYPGHIRGHRSTQGPELEALDRRVTSFVDAVRAAGHEPEVVSGGSTPTLWSSHRVEALTEIRSGSCIFNDREGLDLGVVDETALAYTVLTRVVSTAIPGQAVVDAGSKALAKESRGPGGYGVVLDRPEVTVSGLSEEHGVLDLTRSSWRPRVGERVRVVPNHVCVSVNLQDRLLAFDGDRIEAWPLEARGRQPYAADGARA